METLEVKPRFRFVGREGGRYFWEPLNDEARALMMKPVGSTAVLWFWGNVRGRDVASATHSRAAELGMTPAEYREHVRGLTKGARSRRELEAAMTPLTAEELAELIPAGSWPAGMTRLAADVYSPGGYAEGGRLVPAPVPAGYAVRVSEGSYEVSEPVLRRYGRAFLNRINGSRA